eukprot:TRINITY_DN7099_c0_g3_i1.p1 TRINITY_DN7099_c0_g3~~TRINITY_DN7099_c0_g3_i1.p1  ORF type:complete len:244 (-),score=-18.89 TRINITY_DN7099_c0_g3_i1:596-1327(-)
MRTFHEVYIIRIITQVFQKYASVCRTLDGSMSSQMNQKRQRGLTITISGIDRVQGTSSFSYNILNQCQVSKAIKNPKLHKNSTSNQETIPTQIYNLYRFNMQHIYMYVRTVTYFVCVQLRSGALQLTLRYTFYVFAQLQLRPLRNHNEYDDFLRSLLLPTSATTCDQDQVLYIFSQLNALSANLFGQLKFGIVKNNDKIYIHVLQDQHALLFSLSRDHFYFVHKITYAQNTRQQKRMMSQLKI